MTVQEISVAFADVRAATLRWAVGLPERVALVTRTLEVGHSVVVDLRVLGASHQVLVRDAAGDVLLSETVACDLPGAAAMPEQIGAPGYDFTSGVERLETGDLVARVDLLASSLADDPDALVVSFPGVPHAVTALALRRTPDAISWESWHAYPQTGELVHTTTRATTGVSTDVRN
ncbi:DUF2617 family protein [Nocardioides sp. Soil796]|uniref:DUF2617 family protein n=1 Tax=Nocardioides sp. Soil796 TaxID=1736412 RepID=UPI00070BB43D|nr:DUF2617 family protein [Nocardioides sp. Soil796]KRF10577.1 hypothetical protein ASH02_21040 [Nocardioides sp. Soil796]